MRVWGLVRCAVLLGLCGVAQAADIQVRDAWVRATVPGQPVAGAYMKIVSSRDARLVSVSSPLVARAEVHEMRMDQGVMRMREVSEVPVSPQQPVSLEPGGVHVMLMDLKQPIAEGQAVPIRLVFETPDGRRTIEIVARAQRRSPAKP